MLEVNVVPLPENVVPLRSKKEIPSLKEILKDKDVADFYRLVAKYDFRVKALGLLQDKIQKMGAH